MRLFSLLLEDAPIEDVFIYRTSLYCWTFENHLRIYAIKDLEAAAIATDPDRSPLINYTLFHSRGLGASLDQQAAWHDWAGPYEADIDPPIVINGEAVPYIEVNVQMEGDALLDLLMYYDRLYLATNGGLYAVESFDPAELPFGTLEAERKVPDACYSASAGWGTIAASCGPMGLRLVLDDLRWGSHGRETRKASDESVRSEIGYGSIVNHRSRFDYEFLAATTENTEKGRVLIDTRTANVTRSTYVDNRLSNIGQGIDFTFWDRSRLVVFGNGTALSVSVIVSDNQRRLNRARKVGEYRGVISRIISAARVEQSFAVESDRSVSFISSNRIKSVETGRVVSLRTYPNSRRYQRLTTVTSEQGVWMFGLIE
jgi:hypothetical protein